MSIVTTSRLPKKIDIDKLKQDIPKYNSWMSSELADEWSTFLSSGLTEMRSSACHHTWPMNLLNSYTEAKPHLQPSVLTEEECVVSYYELKILFLCLYSHLSFNI